MEIKTLNNWNKEHQTILDKINSFTEKSDEVQVQKNKFTLLSELLLKLCTSRNIKSNFKNLTSLILLFLNINKKNYPIDVYSVDTKESQLKVLEELKIKRILKQELLSSEQVQ
ncbi:MAG: hypothetical protein HWN80_04920 [Candidatus Lokiarchaeota archaeon]|nr:hypothetical protein [Candidatus Lokiarchaeota archaeon]